MVLSLVSVMFVFLMEAVMLPVLVWVLLVVVVVVVTVVVYESSWTGAAAGCPRNANTESSNPRHGLANAFAGFRSPQCPTGATRQTREGAPLQPAGL